MISIIVAVAENNVIGKDNSLIWQLPADMKYFKAMTIGHCVITGRKNYESIPERFRPLVDRTNIVITRQPNYNAPGAIVVSSIQEAIEKAEATKDEEIFIIGGAEIYNLSLAFADTIYCTRIYQSFDGDTFFPEINQDEWKETNRREGKMDEKNTFEHDFITYQRIK